MKTRIHINQHKIRSNLKNGRREPVITVKDYKSTTYANEVVIRGGCRVVYHPYAPLRCGARVWIETEGEVEIIA